MTQLSFNDQFKPLILSGLKRQTIREHKGKPHRIKAGDTIHFMNGGYVTGVKREFAQSICAGVVAININPIENNNARHIPHFLDEFAKADGFYNYFEMRQWFEKQYKLDPLNGVFSGWLIMWGDLK